MRLDLVASPDNGTTTKSSSFHQMFSPKLWSSASTSNGSPWSQQQADVAPYLSNSEFAALLQIQFDEEDRLLTAERAELAAAAQRLFDCGVCMDTLPEESIARIEPCGHLFCRDCVRGFIVSQIESRRFPLLCPTCTAEPRIEPESIGRITRQLVLDIGITEEQYEVWIEMEMAESFVSWRCGKCGRSGFCDREEYNEMEHLMCPFAGCNYVWCKLCQKEIAFAGPKHSCDGSSEMAHLVEKKGWKYCPTCKTPCEKISGCNFLSCISPGCNTHFCYACRALIVRSAAPAEIIQGKHEHYSNCHVYTFF